MKSSPLIFTLLSVFCGLAILGVLPSTNVVGAGKTSISGVVFFDRNGNGVRDAGDKGVRQVVVELQDGICIPNNTCLTEQTKRDGGYEFHKIVPGSYTVRMYTPPTYLITTSDAQVVVVSDSNTTVPDFGLTNLNTIVGTVFTDVNGDGVHGLGEPYVSNATIRMYDDADGDGILDAEDALLTDGMTTTDVRGNWVINGVYPGKRVLRTKPANSGGQSDTPLDLRSNEVGITDTVIQIGMTASTLQGNLSRGAGSIQTPRRTQVGSTRYAGVRDQVMVRFEPGVSQQTMAGVFAGLGVQVKRYINGIDVYVLRARSGEAEEVVKALQARKDVRYAEQDGAVDIQSTPTDPDYSDVTKVYAPQYINAEAAWDYTIGDPSVIVAVVDTGLSATHPEFPTPTSQGPGRRVNGFNYVNDTANTADDHGHGTHVSGIIAAEMNNLQGTTGIAPGVRIMPLKAFDSTGYGTWSDIASSINFAVANGARVINLSLGNTGGSAAVQDAVRNATNNNVLVVASAGNNGNTVPFYPACYEEAMSIAATDEYDEWWSLSNYHNCNDVSAPGSTVWSTFWTASNPSTYNFRSGTSQAAPHVAGLAALIWSNRPELGVADVRALIEQIGGGQGDGGVGCEVWVGADQRRGGGSDERGMGCIYTDVDADEHADAAHREHTDTDEHAYAPHYQHPHAYADQDPHTDAHADQHAYPPHYQHPHAYADQDPHTDAHADQHAYPPHYQHPHEYADKHPYAYTNACRPYLYADSHEYADKHPYAYTNACRPYLYADSHEYADKHSYAYTNACRPYLYADSHEYADKHPYAYTNACRPYLYADNTTSWANEHTYTYTHTYPV